MAARALLLLATGTVFVNRRRAGDARAVMWENGRVTNPGTLGGDTNPSRIKDACRVVSPSDTDPGGRVFDRRSRGRTGRMMS